MGSYSNKSNYSCHVGSPGLGNGVKISDIATYSYIEKENDFMKVFESDRNLSRWRVPMAKLAGEAGISDGAPRLDWLKIMEWKVFV
jgi:hypothetical protein